MRAGLFLSWPGEYALWLIYEGRYGAPFQQCALFLYLSLVAVLRWLVIRGSLGWTGQGLLSLWLVCPASGLILHGLCYSKTSKVFCLAANKPSLHTGQDSPRDAQESFDDCWLCNVHCMNWL